MAYFFVSGEKMKIGAKEIFDIDIIASLIVAVIIDYLWRYVAINVWTVLQTSIFEGFHYDDLLVLVTDLVLAWVAKGRMRKIFVYAFWFNVAFEVYEAVNGIGGYTSRLP
jgi:hypothetical protein